MVLHCMGGCTFTQTHCSSLQRPLVLSHASEITGRGPIRRYECALAPSRHNSGKQFPIRTDLRVRGIGACQHSTVPVGTVYSACWHGHWEVQVLCSSVPAERGCRKSTFAVLALRRLAGAGAASAPHGALASALLLLLLGIVESACFAC